MDHSYCFSEQCDSHLQQLLLFDEHTRKCSLEWH